MLHASRFFVGGCLIVLSLGCSTAMESEDAHAIKAVEENGGKVIRDENQPGQPVTKVEFSKASEAGLKALVRFKHLSSVSLSGSDATDASLQQLAGLDRLAMLDLTGTRVTDAGLKELAAVKNLTRLIITDTPTTAAGAASLQEALPYCSIQR